MHTLFINGRFTAQRVTGVQRLAAGLVQALDNLLAEARSADRWILVCPLNARPPTLKKIEVRFVGPSLGGLHVWEQCFLPIYTFGQTLLNLAGPAPLLKQRQACMIPDAAVFDYPQAYTRVYRFWYRLLFRTVSRDAHLILTISDFSKRQLIKALGAPAERLKVISCAATHINSIAPDDSVITRLGLSGLKFLLAVGSLNPTKNLPALIAAFLPITDPNVRLVLVGGTNSAVFAGHTLQSEADRRIIVTGAVTDGELNALYRHAHAFVFPSLYEGFGIPPLEAMSLGCPVVAAHAASIPEICEDAALYFNPASVSDITRALARILADRSLCRQLRARGTLRANHFTWERGAQDLFAYLASSQLVTSFNL